MTVPAPKPEDVVVPTASSVARAAAAGFNMHSAQTALFPAYTKSLLQIKVPVNVTLASRRQPITQILDIGMGSLIQFERPCDQLLELRVGNENIALGEAVRVGDKFGLRIVSMLLPDERFGPVSPPANAADRKTAG